VHKYILLVFMERQSCVRWGQRQDFGYVNYYTYANAMHMSE